ncbi:MAG: DUF3597 domain-containing protein [Commensalibacter sp.]|nr:DUF3597 domain-containing protein [Commensalibacter sp.]
MSILSTIKDKIFGIASAATAHNSSQASQQSPQNSATSSTSTQGQNSGGGPVDVMALLASKPNASSLNWRESIVDLLKLLGMDSSLDARKNLAKELGYTESTEDSAAMNNWLIKAVMKKLSENSGHMPENLK